MFLNYAEIKSLQQTIFSIRLGHSCQLLDWQTVGLQISVVFIWKSWYNDAWKYPWRYQLKPSYVELFWGYINVICISYHSFRLLWNRQLWSFCFIPTQQSCWGYICLTLSAVHPASSVCSSVPKVLVGSISYFNILSIESRRCVVCIVSCKIFDNFLNL